MLWCSTTSYAAAADGIGQDHCHQGQLRGGRQALQRGPRGHLRGAGACGMCCESNGNRAQGVLFLQSILLSMLPCGCPVHWPYHSAWWSLTCSPCRPALPQARGPAPPRATRTAARACRRTSTSPLGPRTRMWRRCLASPASAAARWWVSAGGEEMAAFIACVRSCLLPLYVAMWVAVPCKSVSSSSVTAAIECA